AMTAAHLAAKNSQTDVEPLDQRLKKLEAAKEAAIKAADFTKAADIKKSIEEPTQKIKETDQKEKITATSDDVAQSVER
ncbi:ATP-dependent Clp protease ATP-binding subunit, partial [Listeria monocytogenes]|nr:ATP-dependent Clp protease ATP-binding subunit [Listeria monocytogenes]